MVLEILQWGVSGAPCAYANKFKGDFFLKYAVWSSDCCEFQLIPEISSLSAVTTAVPLFSVLTLTAIKYGYDDIVSGAFYYKVINFIP